ncbi:putative HNH endonuclease [Salmonella phage STG2]|uniref:Putative HNH endonuclease n=1 Tax=Salmonella phage STG2 TaxID=2480623 RepID=A0A3G2KAQ0_9CAUD|nr:putative HNH endonuclease [Salmonella phage STG2]AYN56082.1 putative HNH endonuclease [Salmonella phage STG2]
MITRERLLEVLEYHEDGTLTWKPRPEGTRGWNTSLNNTPAGSINADGYLMLSIDGERILAHRAIFFMHKGYLPDIVDHDDTNTLNNRIGNLREATKAQNAFNRKSANKNNLLGLKNISQRGKSFRVKISRAGINYMKTCSSLEEAIAWRDEKLEELHGEFASKGNKNV